MYAPVITGVLTNNYMIKTNTDQGAFIIDSDILNVSEPENITPMVESWIDNSDNTEKYNTELQDYTSTDVSASVYDIINELDKYSDGEQGITNLDTKSTVKLKENGDIDIFVSNSVGIRISKSEHKIYLYGLGLYLNDKEICYNTKKE